MTTEIWKPVPGFEGKYEVSSFGGVRSVDQTIYRKSTPARWKGKSLVITKDGCGYPKTGLGRGNQFKIHRLVALAFIPNPENLPEIDHIDTDKANCRVDNLRWCSHRDNSVHRHEKTYKTCTPKFTPEQKAAVIDAVKGGLAIMHAATKFGMSRSHVRRLRDGQAT